MRYNQTQIKVTDQMTIDYGASQHIAHRKEYFLNIIPGSPMTVEIAYGRQLVSNHKGIVAIQLLHEDRGKAHSILLRSVYFVAELNMSVVSVPQLVNAGIQASLKQGKVEFYDNDAKDEF